MCERSQRLGGQADLIGFHGQTILHQPDRRRTWQIGDAAELAWRTGVPVAYDFRSADVAAGGQGAPLAPVYHAALARELAKPLAVLNIGGVANVTWIGARRRRWWRSTPGPATGRWTTGSLGTPGAAFDRDGALARAGHGRASRCWTGCWRIPISPGPRRNRSTGWTSPPRWRRAASTRCRRLTAPRRWWHSPPPRSPPRRCRRRRCAGWSPAAGGTTRRSWPHCAPRLGAPVEPVEALGWDGDALEAQCFGFLAARTSAGLPISFPGTTGVPHPLTGGRMTSPSPA